MRILFAFARAYPGRSALTLACLIFATLAEGISFSSLLPLLGLVTRAHRSTPATDGEPTGLERIITSTFASVGLQPSIGLLCLVIVGGIALKAAFVLLAQKQVGYTVAHVATDLRLSLVRSLLAARWEYYVRQPVGGLANAFASEASRASGAYLNAVTIVAFGIQTVLCFGLAVVVSWQATLAATAFGVMVMGGTHRLVRMARRAGARQTELLKNILGQLTDVLYVVKPLKAMGREAQVSPLLERSTRRLNRALKREVFSREALAGLQESLLIVSLVCWLYVALTRWSLSLETVFMLVVLFGRTLASLTRAQRQYQRMGAQESAYWSLQETLHQSDAAGERNCGVERPQLAQAVTLDEVSFAYADQPILRRASCTIPAGDVTLLTGPSGTGKTSLVDLIAGLLQPDSGSIRIDGVPLSTVDLQAWRHEIGYVPQEMLLLHESVFANVTLGDAELTAADVEAALRAAEAWDFVRALPDGMETRVGERGARLSGGQRQRIAIARALVHSPQLLILDEATTALDPDSEAAICRSVQRLRGEMTILAISHQPALLDIADHIYRLEAGRLTLVESPAAAHAQRKIA